MCKVRLKLKLKLKLRLRELVEELRGAQWLGVQRRGGMDATASIASEE